MRWVLSLLAMIALGLSGALAPDRAAAATGASGKCLAQEQALDGAWEEYNRISYGSGIYLTNSQKLFQYYSNQFSMDGYDDRIDSQMEQIEDAKAYLREYGDNIEKRFIIKRSALAICYLDFLKNQSSAGGGSAVASDAGGGMRGADSAAGGAVSASAQARQSSGPLPSGKRWGNDCLKIDKLQRARFPQDHGKIYDVINFMLRNECPVDQLYYLNFGGPESSYVSSDFTNRRFQQDAMAEANSAFLPDPPPSDFRPLLRQPPAHTPNAQGFVHVARAGKSYHMEVSAGEADSMSDPYWRPQHYMIAACDVTRGGYLVKMFFNPNQNYFDCIPKTDGAAR